MSLPKGNGLMHGDVLMNEPLDMGRLRMLLPGIQQYFSTGHPWLDYVLIGLVVLIFAELSSEQSAIEGWLDSACQLIKWYLMPRYRGTLEFLVEKSDDSGEDCFTPTYRAIMHKVGGIVDEQVWCFKQMTLEWWDNTEYKDMKESLYRVVQEEPIEAEPGVFVNSSETSRDQNDQYGNDVHHITTFHLTVYSKKYNVHELKKVVDRWLREYQEHKRGQLMTKHLLFNVRFKVKDLRDVEEQVKYCSFKTFRNFNNFFFEQKADVLRDIDFFLTDKEWHKQKGLPDSLGILCHGSPGCGKTSFIKALLARTKRHGVIFSVDHRTDLTVIEKLMRSDTLCDYPIPQDQRIYILEDIDAMGSIVLKRRQATIQKRRKLRLKKKKEEEKKKKKEEGSGGDDKDGEDAGATAGSEYDNPSSSDDDDSSSGSESGNDEDTEAAAAAALDITMLSTDRPGDDSLLLGGGDNLLLLDGDSDSEVSSADRFDEDMLRRDFQKYEKFGVSKHSDHHLGFLLNLLDGLVETPGRIIIMTTNHPEKLDPALIRPGRIDINIEFKKCNKAIAEQILHHFYEASVEIEREMVQKALEEERQLAARKLKNKMASAEDEEVENDDSHATLVQGKEEGTESTPAPDKENLNPALVDNNNDDDMESNPAVSSSTDTNSCARPLPELPHESEGPPVSELLVGDWFVDYVISPAELTQICRANKFDKRAAVKALRLLMMRYQMDHVKEETTTTPPLCPNGQATPANSASTATPTLLPSPAISDPEAAPSSRHDDDTPFTLNSEAPPPPPLLLAT